MALGAFFGDFINHLGPASLSDKEGPSAHPKIRSFEGNDDLCCHLPFVVENEALVRAEAMFQDNALIEHRIDEEGRRFVGWVVAMRCADCRKIQNAARGGGPLKGAEIAN